MNRGFGWVLALATVVLSGSAGCNHRPQRQLRKASRDLGQAVKRGKADKIHGAVIPGVRSSVDLTALLSGPAHKTWTKRLGKTTEVRPEALIFLADDHPVEVVWTESGWRFAEDPTDVYAQSTPRQALRALVIASRMKRWDVLIKLAPKRYRMGLSQRDLEIAWTQGQHAKVLTEARDKLASRLGYPIVADAHEAVLDLGDGHVARLEREGGRWVVVDFLPDTGSG